MTSCKPPPTCIDASPIPDANDSRMSAIPYEANLTPMWVGPHPIGADPVRGEQRLVFQRLAEEALGGLQVALRREQEVNGSAVLVDGPVQVAPLAADLDVCLVDPDRAAMGLAEGPQSLLDQGRVGQHPAVQGGVIDLQTALQEQLLDVTVAADSAGTRRRPAGSASLRSGGL